jgi:hypothetical protein
MFTPWDWLVLTVSFRQKMPVPHVPKGTVSFPNDGKQTVPSIGLNTR